LWYIGKMLAKDWEQMSTSFQWVDKKCLMNDFLYFTKMKNEHIHSIKGWLYGWWP